MKLALEEPGYHKGEICPYAEKTGRNPLLCEEGFYCRYQIWDDFLKEAEIEQYRHGNQAAKGYERAEATGA